MKREKVIILAFIVVIAMLFTLIALEMKPIDVLYCLFLVGCAMYYIYIKRTA